MTENQAYNALMSLLERKGYLKVPLNNSYSYHDVIKIEKRKNYLRAYTEEGDLCDGKPIALLHRLTKYNGMGL